MNKTINTIHFDITWFCNYHCEYCYQGVKKYQNHISDTVYENFFKFLSKLNERFNVHLIGGEPFLYPRFYEMTQGIVNLGHTLSCTTNFSLPKHSLEKFLNIAKGNIAFWEISMHLTQIKNLDEFYEKLNWFYEQSGLKKEDFQINCVLTEDNFKQVKETKGKIEKLGFKFNIQRAFDIDYLIYADEIENWLKENNCIDIPYSVVKNPKRCNVCKKACRTGNKFFKILMDGKVTRCFTDQQYGFNLLGDFSQNSEVKILKDFTPCLSIDNKCRCLAGFNKLGQIDHCSEKTIEYYFDILISKIKFLKFHLKYYYYKLIKNLYPKSKREKLKLQQNKYKTIIDKKAKVYEH